MKTQKGIIHLGLILVLLIFGIGALIFVMYKTNSLPVVTTSSPSFTPITSALPLPTNDLLSDWKTISRSSWKFKVPPNWNYLECNSDIIFVGPSIKSDSTINCAFDGSPGVMQVTRFDRPQAIMTNTDPNIDPYVVEKENITLDGEPVVMQREITKLGQGQGDRYIVYARGRSVLITLHDINLKDTFDPILSTFEFVDTSQESNILQTIKDLTAPMVWSEPVIGTIQDLSGNTVSGQLIQTTVTGNKSENKVTPLLVSNSTLVTQYGWILSDGASGTTGEVIVFTKANQKLIVRSNNSQYSILHSK